MELSELLEETYRIERRVLSFESMLKLLKFDLQATKQYSYSVIFAVDFAEVFRYLHPELDRNRHVDTNVFYTEQVALRYIFERIDDSLVLLPPYLEEFRRHLEFVRQEAVRTYERVAGLSSEDEYIARLKRTNPAIRNMLDAIEKGMEAQDEVVRESAREAKRFFLDLLLETKRRDHLSSAMSKFKDLVEKKKIVFLDKLGEIEKEFTIDESNEEYIRIFDTITKERPDHRISNLFDAKAIFSINQLNRLNKKRKKFFVLISSSRRMRRAFTGIKAELDFDTKIERVSILRDLYYFLLRYYYEDFGFPSALQEIEKTEQQIIEYSDMVAQFRNYVYKKGRSAEAVTDDFVERVTTVYNNIIKQIQSFENLKPTPQDQVLLDEVKKLIPEAWAEAEESRSLLKAIKEIIDNPKRLKEELSKMLEGLDTATKDLDACLKGLP
jgi:hypothetical protein